MQKNKLYLKKDLHLIGILSLFLLGVMTVLFYFDHTQGVMNTLSAQFYHLLLR